MGAELNKSYSMLFGDIHNHNAMGYGVGSLERSIDVAQGHLDFFAFTGHSSWHDMKAMEGGRENHWLNGFEVLRNGWPKVQDPIAEANSDGEFAAYLGFEWHSSQFGDQCVVFPDDHQPMAYPDHLNDLRRFCVEKNALMIPHHLAYPRGDRGVNWDEFDECCTPVVEIFSEHGNSEEDRGNPTFFNHSLGGRQTANTARVGLGRGLKFGFVASSDSHNAFPGAYGEGLLGVLAEDLNRGAIMDAINSRRTWALTGDRIEVDFTVDGNVMGSTIQTGSAIEVVYDIQGRDEMDVVELVQDGRIVHRAYANPDVPLDEAMGDKFQIRLEWGWGPWGDLALERICDWAFDLKVHNGRILRAFPCLQSGPFVEERRHRVAQLSETAMAIQSYSGRKGAYRQNPNQSVILELQGSAKTVLDLHMTLPSDRHTKSSMADLFVGSDNMRTGEFPQENYQWHRLVPAAASRVSGKVNLDVSAGPSNIYLRARQFNGHIAWASPVFMNHD